jgi:4-amino-4-deoxy-L-arabinose transferase-like glycosyltransferase
MLQRLRRSAVWSLAAHERPVLISLLILGVALRGLLVAFSPTPFGYVWDFYHEGVRLLWSTGRLPASTDCWQCYHPPLFYLLGWPFYAFGRWTAGGGADGDAQGLRWLAGLATVSAAVTIYYGYRLLRLFRCRGGSLVVGAALLVTFPCLFISSYGAEADIVLTAILSAFIYYVTRDFTTPGSVLSSLRLGVLAGLAAATKYSGLVAVVSVVVLCAIRIAWGPNRLLAIRNAAIVIVLSTAVGGWNYLDNYRRFGTPLYANGTAAEGFLIDRDFHLRGQYEFTTLRLGALMRVFGPRAPKGTLTDLPVYDSVPTTLHALAWSDMSFFSEPTRHGDPTHPYPRKRVPAGLIGAVLVLGLVPELLAALGFLVTLRRPLFWPLAIVCVVGSSAYVWWFISQDSWGLKTKYLLFLLPAFAVYTVSGFAFLWKHAPRLSAIAGVLVAALFLVTSAYLLAFAVR